MDPVDVRTRITRIATEVIAQHGWSAEAVEHLCGRSGVTATEYLAAYPEFHGLFDDLYAARMTDIIRCIVEVATVSRALDQPSPATASELVAPLLRVPQRYDAWWIASHGFAIRAHLDPQITEHYVDAHNYWHELIAQKYTEVGNHSDRSLSSEHVADAILGTRARSADSSALRLAQAERSAWLALIPDADT